MAVWHSQIVRELGIGAHLIILIDARRQIGWMQNRAGFRNLFFER